MKHTRKASKMPHLARSKPTGAGTVAELAVGDAAELAWNGERVELVYKSGSRAVVKPVQANEAGNYPKRDVSLGCECISRLKALKSKRRPK